MVGAVHKITDEVKKLLSKWLEKPPVVDNKLRPLIE